MEEIEPITVYLKRKLREAGAARFKVIAQQAGVNASFIRKFFYGSRENPRVQTIQPLIDFFRAVECGEKDLAKLFAEEKQTHVIPDRRKTDLESAGTDGLTLVDRRVADEQRV